MSLDWDVTEIKDYDGLCFYTATAEQAEQSRSIKEGEKYLKPETDAIIWLTMFTGIGWGITEANIEEFVARVSFFEKINGPLLSRVNTETNEREDVPLPEEVIRAHVGMAVNVSPVERGEWLLRQFENHYPKVERLSQHAKDAW